MARGSLSENERLCLDSVAKSQSDNIIQNVSAEKNTNGEVKQNGLRVRFLDEEGKTERLVSADEVDCAVTRVQKIHILKNRSSSETSIFLRNPSLMKRRYSADSRLVEGQSENINNNCLNENLNRRVQAKMDVKTENINDETKDDLSGQIYRKNCNVYSVNQAKTIISERKKAIPLSSIPKLIGHRANESGLKSILPGEADSLSDASSGKDFTSRAIGRLSRGLGRLLRRTNSVRISEPDSVFKVAYLGNVLTGWARGDSCVEKPLATLWRNYQQSTKPDVVMKLSVTNSGLKGFTKEHGLTEYWSHRITYCASPPHYPKLFCWVYRHEGKKLKHELRCHAVLCSKEATSKKITEELQMKLRQALVEFKKDRISKQNARLSLANSVYENPSMPRRKILLSIGATNYRPPLERSKSAPKLGAIEELCSEEDEEEAEMNARQSFCNAWARNSLCDKSSLVDLYSSQTLDRRRLENRSPRKFSCPEGVMERSMSDSNQTDVKLSDEFLQLLVNESNKKAEQKITNIETSQKDVVSTLTDKSEPAFHTLESIAESSEVGECMTNSNILGQEGKRLHILSQGNFLVTDSDDGSVSSGCESASTLTSSDTEPSSLPSQFPHEDLNNDKDNENVSVFQRIQDFEHSALEDTTTYSKSGGDTNVTNDCCSPTIISDEVNHVPIGEKNTFRRRSTYPPLKADSLLTELGSKFETLMDNLTDVESLTSSTETEVFKNSGDNDSACSDESGYSELLDHGKESIIGNTIMV